MIMGKVGTIVKKGNIDKVDKHKHKVDKVDKHKHR